MTRVTQACVVQTRKGDSHRSKTCWRAVAVAADGIAVDDDLDAAVVLASNSFLTEGDDGIDLRGAPSRKVASDERNN